MTHSSCLSRRFPAFLLAFALFLAHPALALAAPLVPPAPGGSGPAHGGVQAPGSAIPKQMQPGWRPPQHQIEGMDPGWMVMNGSNSRTDSRTGSRTGSWIGGALRAMEEVVSSFTELGFFAVDRKHDGAHGNVPLSGEPGRINRIRLALGHILLHEQERCVRPCLDKNCPHGAIIVWAPCLGDTMRELLYPNPMLAGMDGDAGHQSVSGTAYVPAAHLKGEYYHMAAPDAGTRRYLARGEKFEISGRDMQYREGPIAYRVTGVLYCSDRPEKAAGTFEAELMIQRPGGRTFYLQRLSAHPTK